MSPSNSAPLPPCPYMCKLSLCTYELTGHSSQMYPCCRCCALQASGLTPLGWHRCARSPAPRGTPALRASQPLTCVPAVPQSCTAQRAVGSPWCLGLAGSRRVGSPTAPPAPTSVTAPPQGCTALAMMPCAPGFFGNASRLDTSSCSGPCAPGYFCIAGSISPTAQPCGSISVYAFHHGPA
jgi:hypothetical protein